MVDARFGDGEAVEEDEGGEADEGAQAGESVEGFVSTARIYIFA